MSDFLPLTKTRAHLSDFEWLDPSAVTTADGHMVITMNQQVTNDLNLISGQVQSWNQLCFNKNAYFETSVSLPGKSDVGGFWPGVWTMGNLGRAGYGATNEGEWGSRPGAKVPRSHDKECGRTLMTRAMSVSPHAL